MRTLLPIGGPAIRLNYAHTITPTLSAHAVIAYSPICFFDYSHSAAQFKPFAISVKRPRVPVTWNDV